MMRYDAENDAYAILGVKATASPDEVDSAYRKSVLRWHPDKCPARDAAEHFHKVQVAARILRDPERRQEYDRLRSLHHRTPPPPRRVRYEPPEPYVPLAGRPTWLTADARVIRDGVLFPLAVERPTMISELMVLVMTLSVGAVAFTADLTFLLLAIVAYSVFRVEGQARRRTQSAWFKVVPARRVAEYSKLDPNAGIFVRYEVPYKSLHVSVTQHRNSFGVEIRGFPQGSVTLLDRTNDPQFALRCAREAGVWLDLPVAQAA